MKRLFVLIVSLLSIGSLAYGAPSTTISIPNTFVAGTSIKAADTNANNNEISSKYNTHTHTDITQVGTITSGTWAGSVIGTQFGGTSSDFSAVASGATIYFNGTGTTTSLAKGALGSLLVMDTSTSTPSWLTQGTANQVLTSNGTGKNPSWVPSGKVVQSVNFSTGSAASGSNVIPNDNTIPQQTEGDQRMSVSFTPVSSTDIFKIDVIAQIGCDNLDRRPCIALFQDAGLDALACSGYVSATANIGTSMFTYYTNSGFTAASGATLKVRMGNAAAGTLYFNSASDGNSNYGGKMLSSITVTEIQP